MLIRIREITLTLLILSLVTGCGSSGSAVSSSASTTPVAVVQTNITPPPNAPPTVFDYFSRSNRILNGDTATSGHVWSLQGPGTITASITDQMFVSPANVYAYLDFGGNISWLAGSFSFVTGSGANDPNVQGMTLIADQTATPALRNMLHLNFGPASWSLTKRISSGPFTGMMGGRYNLKTDGTVYRISMTVSGNTIYVVAPDGKVSAITDTDVGAIKPRCGCWQVTANPDMPTGRWNAVEGAASI